MTRRRFAFWIGFGLFGLADKLRLSGLDALAAAVMEGAAAQPAATRTAAPEHWTATEDEDWRWFEREHYIDGQWRLTGTTAPVHKETGERKGEERSYLDDRLVPEGVRSGKPAERDKQNIKPEFDEPEEDGPEASDQPESKADAESNGTDAKQSDRPQQRIPVSTRRARHGRPPSKWLRSLDADEIHIWLKTVEVPEAGVSGMTYLEHLTRDHSFDPKKLTGLAIADQAKLHAAAHFGY